jgi:hypothetical protein
LPILLHSMVECQRVGKGLWVGAAPRAKLQGEEELPVQRGGTSTDT